MGTQLTYADSGVDIDAGNALIDRIKPFAALTKRSGVMDSLGGFGALFDPKAAGYEDPILVSSTDGVGTKLKLAHMLDIHDSVGIDLVAMCVNDLIVQGAEPLFFLDYFACGALDNDQAASVISSIAKGCEQAGCALIGGETAEMPGMYDKGEYDLAGFAVGAVDRGKILPHTANIKEGDILLGLESSGLHSNGFSLVRKLMEIKGLDAGSAAPFESDKESLGESFLIPTKIYVKSCLSAIKKFGSNIKGLAHITGGGLTENLPRILPENLAAEINLDSFDRSEIFKWIQKAGNITNSEMLKTLNCGIGMVILCEEKIANNIIDNFENHGEKPYVIGKITPRNNQAVSYIGSL